MELQAGAPMKKGNQRGAAYAYNVKDLRDHEIAMAQQAQQALSISSVVRTWSQCSA